MNINCSIIVLSCCSVDNLDTIYFFYLYYCLLVFSLKFVMASRLMDSLESTRGNPAVEVTAMTSSGHVTSPFDSAWPLSYRLPIANNPVYPVVSEIIEQTHTNQMPPCS